MKLLLPHKIVQRLRRELRGRSHEIGGILVGEHVADATFRVVDISIQTSGGTAAHFLRDPAHAQQFLSTFFSRTENNYERFNYLGEWHSHPFFDPVPSGEDFRTMSDIVQNPAVGANFAILIIVSSRRSNLDLSATAFRRDAPPENVHLEIEGDDGEQPESWFARIRRYVACWR